MLPPDEVIQQRFKVTRFLGVGIVMANLAKRPTWNLGVDTSDEF